MFDSPANFYANWRRLAMQDRGGGSLRDQNDLPPERLLQVVWHQQRLHRDALKTSDGKVVRVLHPGFANTEGGPDFRGAVLQIGDDAPRAGDVEIDLRPGGWRAHGHDRNPNFQNVLLHVIWDPEVPSPKFNVPGSPAVLSLQNALDAPLPELSRLLENESLRALPESLRGQCCPALCELDAARLGELLRAAAKVRLETKAAECRARAKTAGWEQALWETLFRALGYKHNVWPMQALAETRARWSRDVNSAFAFQARLLGIGGLLPAELTRAQKCADGYVRRLWDIWWREREEFRHCHLPRAVWKFHGLRPANHPQRRLALAAHWLADRDFIPKIERWIAAQVVSKPLTPALSPFGREEGHKQRRHVAFDSLHTILQVERDEFWSWHWTFRSVRMSKPQPLLGGARVTDLAVNAILPWLWVRAWEGGNEKIQAAVEQKYFAWPAAEDNAILKLARQRLLGTAKTNVLNTAAAQQGLIQIVRDFCGHSNAVCDGCRFPELVRGGSK